MQKELNAPLLPRQQQSYPRKSDAGSRSCHTEPLTKEKRHVFIYKKACQGAGQRLGRTGKDTESKMNTDSWNSTTNNVEREVAAQPTPPTVILDTPTRNIMDIRDVPIQTEEGQFPVRIDLRYRPYYAVIGLYEPKFMLRCYSCYTARAPKWVKSRSSQLETKEPDPDCTCRRIYVQPEEGNDGLPTRGFHLNPYAARENGGTVLRAYPQLPDMLDCRSSADIRRVMKNKINIPQAEIWYTISEPYNPDGTVRTTTCKD